METLRSNELDEIDRQLVVCDFNCANLVDIEELLARRNDLVRDLAGQLRRSLDAGTEMTRRLAGYRGSLNADLQRLNHVALHQDVSDDVPGDTG